jgi:hypothetical protein
MATPGWKNSSSRPEGRRGFAEQPNVVRREVVTPTTYGDGQSRDGTPAGNEHRTFAPGAPRGYLDPAGHAHRAELGNTPHPGMGPRGAGNPAVHSKGATFHGRPHSPGKVGSPGEQATLSGGRLAGKLYVDPIAPSAAPKTYTERVPPGGVSQRVGWVNGQFVPPVHATTRRHGSDGFHHPHSTTDSAQGQANSASGGSHGQPSPRGPQRRGPAPGVELRDARGKQNRADYTSPRPKTR